VNIKRGVLRAFDSGSYAATVQLDGSLPTYVTVPTSRAIASAEMTAGRKVAVLFFDEGNQNDAVLTAVWT